MSSPNGKKEVRFRYGIGEWYGKSFVALTPDERREMLQPQKRPCPFQSAAGSEVPCFKRGGVCSLRLYEWVEPTGEVRVADGHQGALRTTCPARFLEGRTIIEWIGKTLINHDDPILLKEVSYLEPVRTEGAALFAEEAGQHAWEEEEHEDGRGGANKGVGVIDFVLVHPENPALWCALELQAVYFSGAKMSDDHETIRNTTEGIPFPRGVRRPDYRSSGPKRLMPQLQIKVPSLRRWGKKIGVLIDKGFWASLGEMERVDDVSNCDIAWFVVDYVEGSRMPTLTSFNVYFTTLEQAIEGLTAGKPVSLPEFEARLRAKLKKRGKEQKTI